MASQDRNTQVKWQSNTKYSPLTHWLQTGIDSDTVHNTYKTSIGIKGKRVSDHIHKHAGDNKNLLFSTVFQPLDETTEKERQDNEYKKKL